MKNNLSSSNIAIIVLGVLLAVGLFFSAYKTNTKNAEQHSNHHGEAKTSESHDDNVPTNLDEDVVKESLLKEKMAIRNYKYF